MKPVLVPFEPEFILSYFEIEQQLLPHQIAFDVERLTAILAREDVVSFAIKKNDIIIAYCILQIIEAKQINLIELNVAQEHQRQGVGSMLLEHVCRTAEFLNISNLICQVEASNIAAKKFLLQHGFDVTKKLVDYLTPAGHGLELLKSVK